MRLRTAAPPKLPGSSSGAAGSGSAWPHSGRPCRSAPGRRDRPPCPAPPAALGRRLEAGAEAILKPTTLPMPAVAVERPGGRATVGRHVVPDHAAGNVDALHALGEHDELELGLIAHRDHPAGADVDVEVAGALQVIGEGSPVETERQRLLDLADFLTIASSPWRNTGGSASTTPAAAHRSRPVHLPA